MSSGRPASHILAMIFLFIIGFGFLASSLPLQQKGDPGYVRQIVMGVPFVLGFVALFVKARWSYYLCAGVLLLFPLFVFGLEVFMLAKLPSVTLKELLPSWAGCAALFALFYRFTFGQPSRRYYGFTFES